MAPKRKNLKTKRKSPPKGRATRGQRYGFAEESAQFVGEVSARKKTTAKALFKPADPTRTFDLTMTTVDARENFSELLNRVAYANRRVVLTRRGKPLVCVIPMLDVDFIEELEDIMDAKAVDDAKKENAKYGNKTISIEDFAKKLGIDLEKLRVAPD